MVLKYEVIYTDRKTLAISVERDRRVIVRAPKHLPRERIESILERKKLWLFQKGRSDQKLSLEPQEKEFVSGESLLYLGKHYPLRVTRKDQQGISFDREFVISKTSQTDASELFKDWYTQRAKEKIVPRVRESAKMLGVSCNRVKIVDMKYQWGSCSPKNNLSFNWKLIKAPLFVMDYIIVHELAHLIELNHTEEFWNIVAVQVPRYARAKEWLRNNGALLDKNF